MRTCRRAESGQAIVWTAVMLPLLLSIVGLASDGGLVFNARLRLQRVADGAARAGATQVDAAAYRAAGGSSVALDQTRARRVASEYLSQSGLELAGAVDVTARRVVIEVTHEVPTGFIRLVGIETVRVSAAAVAEPRVGVERGT